MQVNIYSPMLPFGSRFKKQGSSSPLGACIEAFSDLISASETFPGNDTSLHEPTEIWFLFLPSPVEMKSSWFNQENVAHWQHVNHCHSHSHSHSHRNHNHTLPFNVLNILTMMKMVVYTTHICSASLTSTCMLLDTDTNYNIKWHSHFVCLFIFGTTASPVGHGLLINEVSRTHTTTHHSRQDSSGRVISSSQRPLPDNTQHSQQSGIHDVGGIRTHSLSRQAAAELCL